MKRNPFASVKSLTPWQRQFIKYVIVGCSNTLISYIVYAFLVFVHVAPVLSNGIALVVGILNSFVWNRTWVFRSQEQNVVKEALLFLLSCGISYLFQLLAFLFFLNVLKIDPYTTQLLTLPFYPVANYVCNRLFVFQSKA